MTSGAAAKPLWQHVLDGYRDPDGPEPRIDRLYPFAPMVAVWVIRNLQALRDLGEEPSVNEFRSYLRSIRGEFGDPERQVVDFWKRLLRNPAHDFRVLRELEAEWDPEPYTVAERIIEQEGLSPSVPERIETVLRQRIHELVVAADRGTREEYLDAFKRTRQALVTAHRLRRTHFGVESD
jgi:hypothetical protein